MTLDYYYANKEEINRKKNIYFKKRKKEDPQFRLLCNLRNRLYLAFKKNQKGKGTKALLGCSLEEAQKHLESLFQEGMTWANYGEWHVDHIIPLKSAQSEAEMEKLCSYTNLQPLWKKDHKIKTAKDIKNIKSNKNKYL